MCVPGTCPECGSENILQFEQPGYDQNGVQGARLCWMTAASNEAPATFDPRRPISPSAGRAAGHG